MPTHWKTDDFIRTWMECADASDWKEFSSQMLGDSDCPSTYTDSDLRRQIGLTRYQLNNKNFAAPSDHKAPKKKKKPGIESVAKKLGLKRL